MQHQRRLDLRDVLVGQRGAIERRTRGEVRAKARARLLTTPPPKQKPIAPILPVQSARAFRPAG